MTTTGPRSLLGSSPFHGRLVVLGFGAVGQAVLPLLLRHVDLPPDRLLVLSPGRSGFAVAREYGVPAIALRLTPQNLATVLQEHLHPGDLLLNLAVDVSSLALMAWCQDAGVLYVDSCNEPWRGAYTDSTRPPADRSHHALRRMVLALRRRAPQGPTAVVTHGASPGLVSHFVKQALLDVARDTRLRHNPPQRREDWARLAQQLGVRSIHIAQRDTQVAARHKKAGEFVNTWSVDAFVDACCQPAELGWGSHERQLPPDGAHHPGAGTPGIYLQRPGASVRVRSWTPRGGPMHGALIAQAAALSIADHLTLGPPGALQYRPTVHCAYRPCDDALLSLQELAERDWRQPPQQRLLKDEILHGVDELGVLLLGHARGAYWYGSQLSVDQARLLCPHNNATTLRVAAGVMAAAVWAIRHPSLGIVEPDEMPHEDLLALCQPYLGNVVGVYSDWTPLAGRGWLFEEDLDRNDPWQFKNMRVA